MDPVPSFRNLALPLEERVQALIGELTLEEKISQLIHDAAAVPRLGIPAYNQWSEALHGVARNGYATVFPQAIGLAATWDPALVQRIGDAVSDELRAKYHATLERFGDTLLSQGLNVWSPNINIFRDPRWGRGQETYGEDPYLTGMIGAAYVKGLQGNHPRYLKAAACAKHYAVHSGPEAERHHFNVQVSPRDLHDTYLPAFKRLVQEAGVESVMGAYNRVNGEPCCSHSVLLKLLREDWGFTGHIVSDCGAIGDFHHGHKVTGDAAESAARALKGGCDLECGEVFTAIPEAIARGLLQEADVDTALARALRTRFKLGQFDPPEVNPYTQIPMSVVNSPAHQALAEEAALKSIVLLKNTGILPLADTIRSICVVGPNATSLDILLGNYCGYSDTMTSLLEGIVGRAPAGVKVEYHLGCTLDRVGSDPHSWAIQQAAKADVVIACMGSSPLLEGEEGDLILSSGDRKDIALPQAQITFLKWLAEAGARIVLVLSGGSPIALEAVAEFVDAILFAWYPGQSGGKAVASILFGDTAPSGKLPVTFPKSLAQLPPFEDYAMVGRTYRYMTEEPLYPFGFGLSYNSFQFSHLQLARTVIKAGEPLNFTVTVANTSSREGEDVVQVYLSDLQTRVPAPLHKLVAFIRVKLSGGEKRRLPFTISPEDMILVTEQGESVLEPGAFRITVGNCSPGVRGIALGSAPTTQADFHVGGASIGR